MKTITDYIRAAYPNCNDMQIADIESLIKDLKGNAEQVAYGQGFKDGREVGTNEGVQDEKIANQGRD